MNEGIDIDGIDIAADMDEGISDAAGGVKGPGRPEPDRKSVV